MTLQPCIPLRAPAGIAAFTFTAAAVPLPALADAFSSAPAVLSVQPYQTS
jgi:hypothetical protein